MAHLIVRKGRGRWSSQWALACRYQLERRGHLATCQSAHGVPLQLGGDCKHHLLYWLLLGQGPYTPRQARKPVLPLCRQACSLLCMMLRTLTPASCTILVRITRRPRACLVGIDTTFKQHLAYCALSSSTCASSDKKDIRTSSASQAPTMEDSESEVWHWHAGRKHHLPYGCCS